MTHVDCTGISLLPPYLGPILPEHRASKHYRATRIKGGFMDKYEIGTVTHFWNLSAISEILVNTYSVFKLSSVRFISL